MEVAHEGTTEVKDSKIRMLKRQFELFTMGEKKSIQDMMTRLTIITNEMRSLDMELPVVEMVDKVLNVLSDAWEPKMTTIIESKPLRSIKIEELVRNLMTHEMMKELKRKSAPKKDMALALEAREES